MCHHAKALRQCAKLNVRLAKKEKSKLYTRPRCTMARIGRRHKAGTGDMMRKARCSMVAKKNVKATRPEQESSTLETPGAPSVRALAAQAHRPPSFNNACVNFDGIEAMDIDEDAFAVTKNNKPHELASARKAKSRVVNEITSAIKSSGNERQQALTLRDALSHPKLGLSHQRYKA
jgi:hypothetical protein